jgi:hypothetical protein
MSPEPLPGPPDDYALLVEFPVLDKERLPQQLYRVHQVRHDPEWFGIDPRDRWSPPAAAAGLFGTCYLATDPVTAVMEAFGDLPVVTQGLIDRRALAVVQIPLAQRLADLTSPAIVGIWKLDRRISTGDDYGTCQRWAHSLRLAGFGGIYYEPRHDPRGNGAASVAMFADPGHQPMQMTVVSDERIPREEIDEVRNVFGLCVRPSSTLPG